MTLTLLLDLDGTLLGNDIDNFLDAYTKALANFFAPFVEPGFFVKTLQFATQRMIDRQGPLATFQETFDAAFYPALGGDQEQIHSLVHEFYRDIFPTLQTYTRQRPSAVQMVEGAFHRGYQVGIATSPLFPRTAIEQRLAWASLPPQKYPFALIPSYETFHFTKPNPAFFAEFLAQIGWPEGPVVVVGNDPEADIAGACLMGLKSFYVASNGAGSLAGSYAPSFHGDLPDLLPWLDQMPPEMLLPDISAPSALLGTLKSTPAVLPSLAGRLPASRLAERPQSREWSLTEILCHLRDVEVEVNLERFQKIVREDNPFLPGMDTDPWAESRQYALQDGQQALWDYIDARLELLTLLDGLAPKDWHRPARHAIFGPTHLLELASIAAGHDRLHVQQAHALLNRLGSSR